MRICLLILSRSIEKETEGMSEKLEGYVDHIIYRNSENGYTVMVLAAHEDEITCVGTFSYINEGEKLA